MATIEFNAEEVTPSNGFEPIPAGEYTVMITSSEINWTKNERGQYLQSTLQILDGAYQNRMLFSRINIKNDSAQAQEIGQRQLSALCHAVGKLRIQDSAELHNIPFIAVVKVRNDPQYGESNEVTSYKSAKGGKPTGATSSRPAYSQPSAPKPTAAQPTPVEQPTASARGAKPAWMNKSA